MFKDLEPDSFSRYEGIRVSTKNISVPISTAQKLKEKGFDRVDVAYDVETNVIRLTKNDNGHFKISWGAINARVGRVMPLGRYTVTKESAKEFLFTKEVV